MIEEAEYVLRDLGFYDVRVRHHALTGGAAPGALGGAQTGSIRHLARIEVGATEMGKFLAEGVPERVAQGLKKLGYAHVTLDLQGYRRGSMNEPVAFQPIRLMGTALKG